MGFQQIQAPTLRELFVDQVIGMIFSGELRVGDRLPSERELSEQMHISRSMVHTGLEDLERMGFVRMEPRRGNYIEDYAPATAILRRSWPSGNTAASSTMPSRAPSSRHATRSRAAP